MYSISDVSGHPDVGRHPRALPGHAVHRRLPPRQPLPGQPQGARHGLQPHAGRRQRNTRNVLSH